MSKHEVEDKSIDVGQVYTKSEQFVENNKKPLVAAAIAVALIIGGWFGYGAYVSDQEAEAQENIWKAQYYFQIDSLDRALIGDGQYFGFEYIADNYSATKTGKLANYYIGIIYKQKGELEIAIDYLKKADIDDDLLGAVALGAIGDCQVDLGNYTEAIIYFDKAVSHSDNSFTAPIYLNKAGIAYEFLEDYSTAYERYKRIVDDYGTSKEAREVKKRLARVEQLK